MCLPPVACCAGSGPTMAHALRASGPGPPADRGGMGPDDPKSLGGRQKCSGRRRKGSAGCRKRCRAPRVWVHFAPAAVPASRQFRRPPRPCAAAFHFPRTAVRPAALEYRVLPTAPLQCLTQGGDNRPLTQVEFFPRKGRLGHYQLIVGEADIVVHRSVDEPAVVVGTELRNGVLCCRMRQHIVWTAPLHIQKTNLAPYRMADRCARIFEESYPTHKKRPWASAKCRRV